MLEESTIGRETMEMLLTKSVKPKLIYGRQFHSNRGEQIGDVIKIYVDNIPNSKDAAQTIVHEATHLYYNIGHCQWQRRYVLQEKRCF